MKKVTFTLLALIISGTAFAQNKAVGTATVQAEIVEPLTIAVTGNLNFGKMAAPKNAVGEISGDGDQTVTLSHGNVRTIPAAMVVPGSSNSVPTFTVAKDASQTYKVVVASTNLEGAGEEIVISDITTSLPEGTTGYTEDTFTMGASLLIKEGQKGGSYEGSVSVTVSYE